MSIPAWDGGTEALTAAAAATGGHRDRTPLCRLLLELGEAGAARRLASPDCVLVLAGQQPAVGGGPLYTLVKAAQAAALAERLTATGRDALAWFWCASEDHDLGEARHCDLLRRDGSLHRFQGDLGPGRSSLRFRPADTWWEPCLDACRRELGPGPGEGFLRDCAPRPGEGLGAWECRLLARLVPGLVAVEAHRLRPLWTPALNRALDAWPAEALAQQRRSLLAAGCIDAFGLLDRPPLFADRPEGRCAIDPDQARKLLPDDANLLSPGAALRPILQQAALPVAVAVLGPGELAYHHFILPLYPALQVPQPLFAPRISCTLVPDWCAAACAERGIDPRHLPDREPPLGGSALAALDAALAGLDQETHPGALARLRRERDRLERSLRRRQRGSLHALGSLRAWLRPRNAPQDRSLAIVQAVWEHGEGLGRRLVAEARCATPGEERLITLAGEGPMVLG